MDRRTFSKSVTVWIDTREQKYGHITDALDALGIKWERRKLDIGDVSFGIGGRDFSGQCAIERKADVDELYGNLMEKSKPGLMIRLEKEIEAANRSLVQFVLMVEGVASMEELRAYVLPDWQIQNTRRVRSDIGAHCYERLRSWQSANRYGLRVECVKEQADTAGRILDIFYYYYRNYKTLIAPRRGA